MKSWGARGIARVSVNPGCAAQAAMVLLRLREEELYEYLTGHPDPIDHGERTAALRWGRAFDTHLAADNAEALLQALDGQLGLDPATVRVRDLRREVPGDSEAAQAARHRRTLQILSDLVAGGPSGDVLLQPTLRLALSRAESAFIIPDALVLDADQALYVPLEAKAFVAVEGTTEPGDRATARRQAAVSIVALGNTLSHLGFRRQVSDRAFLVMASPFGLRPHRAFLEELPAEVAAVRRALDALRATAKRLVALGERCTLEEALTHLSVHFQESCLSGCGLADVCKHRTSGLRGLFGDAAEDAVSPRLDMPRVMALLDGDPPRTREDVALVASLTETAALLGWRS